MLKHIKEQLSTNSDQLIQVLEAFGFANIQVHSNYISFGRDAESSKKSIVMRTENNDWLYITDYAKNVNEELFSYICHEKSTDLVTVLNKIKSILGIDNYYAFDGYGRQSIFGGFYDNIKSTNSITIRTYDMAELDRYEPCPNKRFLKDNISLAAQKYFGIRYDIDSQCIVIPILDQYGQLMAVKARCNYEVADGDQKYWYLLPGRMSMSLYGYCQNYQYLANSVVYLFESEKSVMQCFSYGIRNSLALGSGTISEYQVKMIMELQPKAIILMHDTGYDQERVERNIQMISDYTRFCDIPIGYWNWINSDYPNKVSPSDLGKAQLEWIMENEIKWEGGKDEEIQSIS